MHGSDNRQEHTVSAQLAPPYVLGRYTKTNFLELLWQSFLQARCPSCHTTASQQGRTEGNNKHEQAAKSKICNQS